MKKQHSEFEAIPGFGPAMTRDLNVLGFYKIKELKGKNPEKLYLELEKKKKTHIDRCVLYGLREAVYFAEGGRDPKKLQWWNWKNKNDDMLRKEHICTKK